MIWNGRIYTSIEAAKIDQDHGVEKIEETRNVRCCDSHANETCTIAMEKMNHQDVHGLS